jgi:GDPmannose 4,6-dehydratase
MINPQQIKKNDVEAKRDKKAIVLGVNGQDGSYIAESLIRRGWEVYGIGRQNNSKWLQTNRYLKYYCLDIADVDSLSEFLEKIKPDAIFHFAALHGPAGFDYESHWREVHKINVISLHAILEYQRKLNPAALLIYASSSKVFGSFYPKLISECSPRISTCIYSTTKNAATDLIQYYRKKYELKSSVVWTFNHESERREKSYFFPKIIDTLAKAIIDKKYKSNIENLSFWCDWGDANEYMHLISTMPESGMGVDVIFATGKTIWAEDFVSELFGNFKLDWRSHIQVNIRLQESSNERWEVDTSKLFEVYGKTPEKTVFDISNRMLEVNYPISWAKRKIEK